MTTTATRDELERTIDAMCLRASYSSLRHMAIGISASAAAYSVAVSFEVPWSRLGPWLAGVFAINVARLVLWRAIHGRPLRDDELNRFRPAFYGLGALAGAWWSALVMVTDFSTSPLVVCTTFFAISGMLSGGAISTAGTPRYVVMVMVISLIGPVAHVAISGSGAMRALLLGVAGHVFAVMGSLRQNHAQLRESIALRFENQDLVKKLSDEKELELAARRDAERANLEKSRFLAAASHDARQPLHALGLFVDTLKAQPLGAPARQLVSSIDLAQTSLVSLHEGLLDLATLDVGAITPRPCSVRAAELLRVIENESAPRAKERGLSLCVAGAELSVKTDPALALRVLRNLVANALAYTERGGVLVTVRRRGARALWQVWDTGIGIAPADQERIFDELVQVGNAERSRERGLGLGLSIVKRLATTLGCEVRVRSTVGKGSVFSFELPLAPASPLAPEAHERIEVIGGPGPRGQVVLLVDDDAQARQALGTMLGHWGYEVISAASAEDALEFAAELDRLDVVVSDEWLPGRSGLELLSLLATQRPALQRVLLSGDTSPATTEKARAAGVAFLRKPVRAAVLREILSPADRVASSA